MFGVTRTTLPKGDEMEIRIVIYSPVKEKRYIADVYCNGKRIYCGTGIHIRKSAAISNAINWIAGEEWMD